MSIGRLIKKATSILLIVAMVMTSVGFHTLANSVDAVVEMNDTVGASFTSPEEDEKTVVEADSVVTGDSVEAVDSVEVVDSVEENDGVEENENVDEPDEASASEAEEEAEEDGARGTRPYDEEPEEDEATTEKEETTEEVVESEETTVAAEEETTEEAVETEETTVAEEENIASASEADEEIDFDFENVVISTSSEVLLGTDTITLTYNFNDKSNGGKGSTDAIIADEDKEKVPETKVVENGKEYGAFEKDIFFGREGYTLLGWSFERDGEVIKETDVVDLAEDTTIYAIWEPKKYKFRISENLYQNNVKTDGKGHIEFTFDEKIIKTINDNGLKAPTKDTDPEIYDCLEFVGWGFNGETDDKYIIKDTDNYTDVDLIWENAHEPYLMAIYDIKYVHVKLNANDLGYYLDEGAEDIEENRKKILDLGLIPAGVRLNEAEGYREPIPFKDMRFEKWWRPLIPDRPYEPTYKDFNIAPGGRIGSEMISKEVSEFRWNQEYKAHYEEDRYPIVLRAGSGFYVTVGDISVPADDRAVFVDDGSKFSFTDRLGNVKGWGSQTERVIYALKGRNLKEVLDEIGFEDPVAYDRTLLGWQQGWHPDRVNGQYVNFNPVDFSKFTIEGPLDFTAVFKKKPLILTFKKGPNMKFASGRDEYTIEFPARDKYRGSGIIDVDVYVGSLYDCEGYEDPICLNDAGEVDDYNYEFKRWEDDEELLEEKMQLDVLFIDGDKEPVAWQENKGKYKGLEHVNLFDTDWSWRQERKHVFENGENFYVDYKGRKYADHIRYGGDPYRAEPYVFTPVVDRIQMAVSMYSPFPVFALNQRRADLTIGSGINIGQVDEFVNTDFSEVEKQGYHFLGWYQVDHERIKKTLVNFQTPPPLGVDEMEEYFDRGMPTIVGMSSPGLDTWWKYVQCTRTDDLNFAVGNYFKRVEDDLVINRHSAVRWDIYNRSKMDVPETLAIDVVALFAANLTLNAGDGKFVDGSNEKIVDSMLIDTITPINEYVAAGYEVPTPNDDSKVFAGWRLETIDGRLFGEHESISKDTRLVASYIDKKDIVTLTIDLHGAEMTEEYEEEGEDEEGNKITIKKHRTVEMQPVVITLPQGLTMNDVENDYLPVVKRNGYIYSPIKTLTDAWYYNYDNGEYSNAVKRSDVLNEDKTIHLKWTKEKFTYNFLYEIDGEEEGYVSINGEFGQALKDCIFYTTLPKVQRMFDFSLENQPKKGYKITSINMSGEGGKEVTPDSVIEGHVNCKLTIKPIDTTITFDANGGELVGENTLTVPYATYYKDIKDIVPKASYSDLAFVGWVDDKGVQVTDKYRVATSYDEDKIKQAKFTAEWTEMKIAVTFDAGNGKFSNGTNKLSFEKVPYMQILSSIKEGDKVYEEPTLANKVFDRWEVILRRQYNNVEYTKDSKFGEKINNLEEEIKSEIVLKALYVDKTVTFAVKLYDPNQFTSGMTFAYLPTLKENIIPHDYVYDITDMISFHSDFHSGGTYIQTVKEGMTFGQWFDYMYSKGYRYRTEDGYLLCGWKYEEPASIEAPRKKTFDMKDVDMNAPIKDGDVFTPLMAKGSFTVKIDANGGAYRTANDRETSTGVRIHQESSSLMVYENVPAGTKSDKIDGIYLPVRSGYTLIGYSRYKDISQNSLSSVVFVAGDEYLYAIWSKNGKQRVQPTVQTRDNSNSGGGGSGTGGAVPAQNANDARIDTVEGIGPQDSLPADAPKQYTQNVSVEENQQTQAQVTQLIANAGISADAANTSQVQQAVAEVVAGMNIVDQYAKITAQITANPSITTETTKISDVKIEAKEAYWHTDADGNVTLQTTNVPGHNYGGRITDVWQPVTNDAGQTGWYKFDANGHMQTGLVQDGNCTYYLSEERGAGYGQMVCNQTINIGGLSMTFNASGALVDMSYSVEAAVKTLQNAVAQAQVGPQPAIVGPQPAQAVQVGPAAPAQMMPAAPAQVVPAGQNQVGPATFLSTQVVGPGV